MTQDHKSPEPPGPLFARSSRHDGWTVRRQRDFLQALAECGCVVDASRAVGMSRESAYNLKEVLRYRRPHRYCEQVQPGPDINDEPDEDEAMSRLEFHLDGLTDNGDPPSLATDSPRANDSVNFVNFDEIDAPPGDDGKAAPPRTGVTKRQNKRSPPSRRTKSPLERNP